MSGSTRQRKIVAFDWDARNLRLVSASIGKRGPRIDRLLSVAIPPDVDVNQPEQMGGLLRRVLDQEGISTTHAIVDIPRDQAILNTLTLPCQVPDELPNIVAIQIAKQLPFAVGDAVIDFALAPHAPDAVTADVLVAAVRHELLKQYEAVFTSAGLKLVQVGLRPLANQVAVCELLKHGMPDRVLFIDVGPTLTEINVLRNSFLAFSRAASVHFSQTPSGETRAPSGENPFSLQGTSLTLVRDDASVEIVAPDQTLKRESLLAPESVGIRGHRDEFVSTLLVEVRRSIEAYRATDPAARIDHAVIGGDLGVEEALSEAVQRQLRITTELYNPATSFGWEPDEGVRAAGCAATLGLVLGYSGDDALQFDFLHPKKTVSATQRRLKAAPLVAAVVVLFLAAGAVALAAITKPDREQLARQERKIKELKAREKDNEKFMAVVKEVRKFDTEQQAWVDVLYDITAQLPAQEELVVTQMDLNQKDSRVTLKTRTKSRETATDAERNLGAFRREGKEKPRFKAKTKGSMERPGEVYPFVQDLEIKILLDEKPGRRP